MHMVYSALFKIFYVFPFQKPQTLTFRPVECWHQSQHNCNIQHSLVVGFHNQDSAAGLSLTCVLRSDLPCLAILDG